MHKYELTIVVNPNFDDEACKAEAGKVKADIEKFGGTVEKTDEWGRRRLAYEIEKLTEGYYVIFSFDAPPETPGELESRLRINENLLRYLTVRVDE